MNAHTHSSAESDSDSSSGILYNEFNYQELQPYSGEPEIDGQTDESSESDDSGSAHELDSWCYCGQCRPMKRRAEEVCCKQHAASNRRSDSISTYKTEKDFNCITEHPGLFYNCLVSEVLDESWKGYRQMYGKTAADGPIMKRRRHVAYRNLARLVFGFTRKNQRMVLPACAVNMIREKFPDTGSQPTYTGFKKRKAE